MFLANKGGILMRYSRKRAHPKKIIAGFQEVFKGVCVKKTSQRNFFLTLIAVSVSKTFRINAIASRLPIDVAKEKSKEKRLLRFLDTPFPSQSVMEQWLVYVLCCVWRSKRALQQALVLIDETDLPGGWKAIVASVSFRNRAIPIYWHIYKNAEISDGTYRSHNEIIQNFCVDLNKQIAKATGSQISVEPVFIFDRGFARAKYVIKFLDDRGINVVMRVPRNVGVRVNGSLRKLDDLQEGSYSDILYHATEALPLNLYIVRDEAHDDPMYLISNRVKGQQLHTYYKRRMQIEHGFRDLKSCFNFKDLVLKKTQKPRIELLFLIGVLAYGLLFLTYEKAAGIWQKTFHSTRKIYSVISIIKKVIEVMWTHEKLLLFTQQTCLRNLDFLTTQ